MKRLARRAAPAAANCIAKASVFLVALTLAFAMTSPCSAQGPDAAATASGSPSSDSVQRPPHRDHDSLLGLDKPKHFLLSAFIESVTFSSLQATGSGYRTHIAAAAGITGLFAVGKELHDRRTTGLFSFGDLFWDAAGAATAVLMLRHTYR